MKPEKQATNEFIQNNAEEGRRRFLKTAAITAAGIAAGAQVAAQSAPLAANAGGNAAEPIPALPSLPMTNTGPGQIPHKPLGKTGATVSVLGMGGHHLGDVENVDDAIHMVQQAVDAGITFFDNC